MPHPAPALAALALLLGPSLALAAPELPPLPPQVPAPPANAVGLALPLALGEVAFPGGRDNACPAGFSCQAIRVTCPGVSQPLNGWLATAPPTGPPRGTAVFFSGGGGTGYELAQVPALADLVAALRADGFQLVQVRWTGSGWLAAPAGEQAGFGKLACRPATVIAWVHDHLHAALGLGPGAPGVCGFCVQGNSGGSTQVGFALSHYGLDSILDAVLPTGGPPHGALHKACLRLPGQEGFQYPDGTRRFLDSGWGFYGGGGPCERRDPVWAARFAEDSVAWGGSDYAHPATRVHILVGAQDAPMAFPAGDYRDRLRLAGSPWVAYATVPNTPHFVLGSPEGRAAVRAALLAEP